MIILRKPSTTTTTTEVSTSVLVAGNLTGNKDGINKAFLTEYTYEPDRITVYYNGQALHAPNDFYQSGHNEIIFIYLKPEITDVLKTTYQTTTAFFPDLDLIYNNGVWETSESTYTSLPSSMKVYVNGIKQDDAYYQAVINSGKIEVSFGFYTNASYWVHIDSSPMADEQDLTFNIGTWSTSGGSYTTTASGLQVYLNGRKQSSDYYTTTVNGGEIEIVFDTITSSNDWVNFDAPTSIFPQDIDLVYNSGFWETPDTSISSLPLHHLKVYVNGVKQDDNYLAITIQGTIRVIFDFMTTATDWVNITA